ncbi:Adenine specific DNA methylase Mod [Candidatus Hepatincola sp. Pdp]
MEKNKGKKTTPTSNNQNIESSVTGSNLPSNTTMSNPVKEYNSNNSQNHQNLKDYLQQHYPNLFREGKLSFQELKDEIGQNTYNEDIVEENFSFGLSWAGEKKAKAILSDEVEKTLVYDEDKSLHGKSSENILIEGDNLEALKLLSNGYYNSIKMIYIDPPYNTGNDFVYNDKFSTRETEYLKATNQKDEAGNKLTSNPKSNGRFHSNWLTMMYPRLRLARDLLKEDGVIFISIDDNEVANLKLLCNQIFGEENFKAQIVWRKTHT